MYKLCLSQESDRRIKIPVLDRAILRGLSIIFLICNLMYYPDQIHTDSSSWLISLFGFLFTLFHLISCFSIKRGAILINSLCLNIIGFYSFYMILSRYLLNVPADNYWWYFLTCAVAYLYHIGSIFLNRIEEYKEARAIAIIEIIAILLGVVNIY